MSMRTLCLAGALTVGLGSAAFAQSVGVYTPFGGVGVYGPDHYAYGQRYDRYGDRYAYRAYRPYRGRGAYDAYAYAPAPWMYPPGNLHRANPNANPNLREGWSLPEQDQYRNETGINSN